MNLKKLTTRFFITLSIATLSAIGISCEDTETTNTIGFAVYYYGVTDIGPSMSYTVNPPTYVGGTPSEFNITNITLNGEVCSSESFIIDPNKGSIEITNTENLAVGLYSISIGCKSNGSYHEFKDAIAINMMAPVPDGIKVEPNYIKVNFQEVGESKATAQVTTEGEHVSIRTYAIAKGPNSDFFKISNTGVISINKDKTAEMQPGIYPVSLKLTTLAGEGIFENAITFNITSKPLSVTYNSENKGKIEEESVSSGPTSYTSPIPTLKGSTEGLIYSIEKVTPATDKIKIDPTTGVLSVAANHGMINGTDYVIDIKVINEYAPEGIVMEGAFTLSAVGYIAPIENFSYTNVERVQYTSISVAPSEGLKGDDIQFSFVDPDPKWNGKLLLNSETGAIKAEKNNTIPIGTYTITVQAINNKGSQNATFTLNIKENPNDIQYIYYGNNLGLDKTKEASQYRVKDGASLAALNLMPTTNLDGKGINITWKITSQRNMANATIDPNTGKITLSADDYISTDSPVALLIIEASAGSGEEKRTLKIPVAFDYAAASSGVTIEYTPFVFKVNPNRGGTSTNPVISGISDTSQLLLDYRRSFFYYNLNGPKSHKSGAISTNKTTGGVTTPADESYFMNQVWRNYYGSGVPNYGEKSPMSTFKNTGDLTKPLGYVIPETFAVKINANKWYGDDNLSNEGEAPASSYANGIMIGQMTFTKDKNENNINNGSKIFPILIWFDENF